jgi:hypothetical protein
MSKLTRRQFLRVSAVATAGAFLAACGKTKAEDTATPPPVVAATSKPEQKATDTPAGPQRPMT